MKKTIFKLILIINLIALQTTITFANGFGASPTYAVSKETNGQFVFEAKQNSEIKDIIKVTNFENSAIKVKLYPTDLRDNLYNLESDSKKEIAEWTQIEKKELMLSPNESQEIPFTINIPSNAEKKDYAGGIASEVEGKDSKNNQAKVNYRIVTKINLKITDTPKSFEKIDITKPDTKLSLTQIYFYISAVLFIIIGGYFLISFIRDQRKKETSEKESLEQHTTHHKK